MNPRPYTVITSKTAKDHLGMAKNVLNEMRQGIFIQQQKNQQRASETQQLAREDQQTKIANAHEQQMQMNDLAATAMIK